MSTRAISTAISKAKTIFGSAVYHKRRVSIAISKRKHVWDVCHQQSKSMAKALLDDTACRPVRYINRDQKRKSISCAAVYQQSGIAVYHYPLKIQDNAFLDDTAVSSRAVFINRESCKSTAIIKESECTTCRHSRVDLGGASTANSKTKASVVQLFITSAVQLYINSNRNFKRTRFWTAQSCRPGRDINLEVVYH